jgi:predicted transcriptional regulator
MKALRASYFFARPLIREENNDMRIGFGMHWNKEPKDLDEVELQGLVDWIEINMDDFNPRVAQQMKHLRARCLREIRAQQCDGQRRALSTQAVQALTEQVCEILGHTPERIFRETRRKISRLVRLKVTPTEILTVARFCRREFDRGNRFAPLLNVDHIFTPTVFTAYLAAAQATPMETDDFVPDPDAARGASE